MIHLYDRDMCHVGKTLSKFIECYVIIKTNK